LPLMAIAAYGHPRPGSSPVIGFDANLSGGDYQVR